MRKIVLALASVILSFTVIAQKMTDVKFSGLPEQVGKYIKDKVPGAKMVKAVKIEDKGSVKYNVAIDLKGKKFVYVFDKNGKFLKKEDDVTAPSNKVIINKASEKSKSPSTADSARKSKREDGSEKFLVRESSADTVRNRP